MNIRKYLKISLGVVAIAATQISCVHDDNWDAPEITCTNKFDAPTKELAQVIAMAPAGDTITIENKPNSAPIIFDGYVVSSDEQGNFYKTISIQDKKVDPTAGIQIEINKSMNYADFPVGAHVRIKANGLVIGTDGTAGVIKLGSRDPNYRIGRIPQTIVGRYMSGVCDGNGLEIAEIIPTEVSLSQLIASNKYINTLVKVKNVQFDDNVIGKTLMDKGADGTFADTDRRIVDVNNSSIAAVVRTDGFFKETSYVIPNKSGNITFVASKYNSSYQNIIRSTKDFELTTDLPPKPISIIDEPFNNFTANGWTIVNVAGPTNTWKIEDRYGNPKPSALMNGFGENSEDWLISKEISLEDYSTAEYSFDSWRNFTGSAPLAVLITTAYTGDHSTTQWTALTPTIATSNSFIGSGIQSLNSYVGKKIRIAFKYTSTSSSAYSYEIDNFVVKGMKK